MDLDPTLRGGLEMGLKICPMKASTYQLSKKDRIFMSKTSLSMVSLESCRCHLGEQG